MKKFASIVVSGIMFLSQFAIFPVMTVNAVTKNSENIYEISTAQDLVDFATLVNNGETKANAILTADINMSGINFDPIGTYSDYSGIRGYDGVTSYRGTFDGNGYIISNLTVTTNERIEAGLFGRGSGAIIKDLGIKNAKISNTAGVRAGILAGELHNCNVSNVYTTGKVTTDHKQKGGIAGESAGSTLTDCFSSFSPYTNSPSDAAVKSVSNCGVCSELFAFDGFGSEERPFLISNKNDLIKLSDLINTNETHDAYRKRYYRQTSDIDLDNVEFSPIGTYSDTLNKHFSFNGVYDGDYKSIHNLYETKCEAQGGLFALVSGESVIKNLSVDGTIDVNTEDDIGGIAGNVHGAAIYNCSFNGTISGVGYVGGIVGEIWRTGTVEGCYFNGDLTAKSLDSNRHSIGGITGDMTAGYQDKVQTITVKNSYATGAITAPSFYMIGGVSGSTNKNNDESKIDVDNNLYLFSAINASGNGALSGCGPVSSIELKNSADRLGSPYVLNPVPSYNDGYPVFEWQLDDAENSIPVVIPFTGNGRKDDPYQIETAEDLIMLSDVVNDKTTGDYFRRCYYIQAKDIDLNNEFLIPIGLNAKFIGEYNGNYHKIINLRISTSKNSTGLFGSISDTGSVYRLSVEGNVTSSGSNVGGIVGTLSDGAAMTDCDYHGNVKGEASVGALVGLVQNGATIETCYSDAIVTGQSSIGGLIGSVKSGAIGNTLSKMYFAGTVSCGNTEQGAIIGTSEDAKLEFSSIYFLSSICSGNAVNGESAVGCTKLSTTALKACSDMLGSPFTSNSLALYGGYPIFEWQSTAYQFRGGGTESNPYRISSKADLENMRDLINSSYYNQIYGKAYYIQMADIDLEDELWIPIASSNSGQKFSGTYDGACHYIKGLNVNSSAETTGLFGVTNSANIHDIVVYGSVIGSSKDSGGIIGNAQNSTALERCGFVGSASSNNNAGGLIGKITNSCTVMDCYHNGKVSSSGNSGGIAGNITFDNGAENAVVSIQNCYQANGVISGSSNSGCIVGSCNNTSNTVSILNCFATTDADAVTNLSGATKDKTLLVTKSMLKGASEDLGNAFTNNATTLNDGYPVFKWQIKSDLEGDVNNDGVFNVADVIMLQKWLLCAGPLTTWENGDLCNDNRIDVFDLCMMKRKLING